MVRRAIVGLVAACAVAGLVAPAAVSPAQYPACFGAAARDPVRSCNNPDLALTVVPTPGEAQILPNTPCAPVAAPIAVCGFGVSAATAAGTVALVGDSHAEHWRGAVEVLAHALHWHALSITRPSCPFSGGPVKLPEPRRKQCREWTRGVLRWLTRHPEVSTVFVSGHPAPVEAAPGQSQLTAQVEGYVSAWKASPASIKHIIVIHDIPAARTDTLACVERAIAKLEPAGLICAIPRSAAVRRDIEVVAAERIRSSRVQIADLTNFFCDSRRCYPVVGGALVYKDAGHLNSVFSTTLGPFLLDELARLMASWR